jgi:hypothetical protein
MPSNAQDVSEAVSIVRRARETFSVLSGGHMPVPGAQSNNGGVQIALANLNSKKLSKRNSVASIGPGSRWVEVYNWLQPYGLSVAGGRYSTVGVGGVLVGGGINYFGNRVGFSVNTLVSMQVVLGDGSIVEVSDKKHPDLFWALKGGNNNFGIVTRFDLETIAIDGAWGGIAGWTGKEAADEMVQAMEDFLFSPEGIDDPYTEINPSITISPNSTDDDSTWLSVFVPFVAGNHSEAAPASVANFTAIPNPLNVSVLGQQENYVELLNQVHERNTQDVYGLGQIYGTLSAKLAPGIVRLAVDTVLTPAMEELANVTGAFVAVSPEPISHLMVEAAAKSGPYAIDLDPKDGSFLSECSYPRGLISVSPTLCSRASDKLHNLCIISNTNESSSYSHHCDLDQSSRQRVHCSLYEENTQKARGRLGREGFTVRLHIHQRRIPGPISLLHLRQGQERFPNEEDTSIIRPIQCFQGPDHQWLQALGGS